jgi:O-antigen/teichoic acid export membrane protein
LIPGLHWWPHFESAGIKEVFSYGIFSFTNAIIGNTSNYIDRIILGVFIGAKEVAYLTAPKELLTRASGATGAAGQALFPRFSSMENKRDIAQLYVDSTWMLLCFSLVLFIPLTILLPEFLSLWISPEFSRSSATVAQLITIGFSLTGVTVPYFAYLKGSGKIHWLTMLYFISSGLSIISAIILINIYGLLGAGIRVCLLSWTVVVISVIVLKKGLDPPFMVSIVFRSMVLPLVISTAFAWPMYYLWDVLNYHGWVPIILGYSVMAGLLAVLLAGIDLVFFKEKGVAGQLVKIIAVYLRSMIGRLLTNG